MHRVFGEVNDRNTAVQKLFGRLGFRCEARQVEADWFKGEWTTVREREVLRLRATELSGPEIAGHLFVSVNTLRTHTKHIFSKLDVNTRRAAVRRAGELGLL